MESPIKTYSHTTSSERSSAFAFKRTEEIYDNRGGKADAPHRHTYYTVVLVRKGEGKHIVDFNEYQLGSFEVWFVSPGQVHQIIESSRPSGYVITFSPEFLLRNSIDHRFISNINLFRTIGDTPPLKIDLQTYSLLESYLLGIERHLESRQKYAYEAIGALLKLFLIACNHACELPLQPLTQSMHSGTALLVSFKDKVERDYVSEHSVKYYAEHLGVTPDHLNKTVKSLTGQSAKEVIVQRIILGAKRMLLFSSNTAKEIAYDLGFDEPAHFSQFFKRYAHTSPSEFRSQGNA